MFTQFGRVTLVSNPALLFCGLVPSQFLVPGFVDTHTHAPQFPNNGLALDLPLLEWLQTYTFPTEANFSDTVFAREVYTKVVVSGRDQRLR